MMLHARMTMLMSRSMAEGRISLADLINVDDEGVLTLLEKSRLDSTHKAVVVSILAHFLELLTDFIGHNLVLRMVHQAWPDFEILQPFSTRKREQK